MRTDEAPSPPFDEQAALEELERLRDAIEGARRQRSQRSDEFEAFVRSFRTPPAPDAPKVDAPTAPGTDVVAREQHQDLQPLPVPVEQALPVEQPAPPPVSRTTAPPKRGTSALVPRALGGAAILIASAVLLTRPWKAVRSETTPSPSTGGAATTASAPSTTAPDSAAAPAAMPAPAPPAADAHALQAELNVQRRVWLRVLVDGERTIERELPAGTRIPLQADRAIVIRSGDAGALRITINGVDRGPLGKDAEIITRTFTAPR